MGILIPASFRKEKLLQATKKLMLKMKARSTKIISKSRRRIAARIQLNEYNRIKSLGVTAKENYKKALSETRHFKRLLYLHERSTSRNENQIHSLKKTLEEWQEKFAKAQKDLERMEDEQIDSLLRTRKFARKIAGIKLKARAK